MFPRRGDSGNLLGKKECRGCHCLVNRMQKIPAGSPEAARAERIRNYGIILTGKTSSEVNVKMTDPRGTSACLIGPILERFSHYFFDWEFRQKSAAGEEKKLWGNTSFISS
ncbi:unnamed protein product [Caretta caretta]